MKAFVPVVTDNKDVKDLSNSMKEFAKQLASSPIIDGILIRDIDLTTGSVNIIQHGLGRNVIGWILVSNSTGCIIWDSQATNTDKDKFIYLNSSANTTASIWIF